MNHAEAAAVRAAAVILSEGNESDGTVEQQGASEEVAAQGTETQEEELPQFEIELPEDLLQELEEDDFEETSVTEELEQDEDYQMLDEQSKRLLARALAAEKRAEHYEKLRLNEAKKNWSEEAKKFFPLAEPFLNDIQATSRKGFLREAKARHEAVLPLVKPLLERKEAETKAEREKVREEEKQAAKERWGSAPENQGQPAEASITQEELARNRSKGDLAGTLRAMMFPTKNKDA